MTQRVVVGVDGSPASAAALAWAAAEARLRGAELVAWTILDHSPSTPAAETAVPLTPPSVSEEFTGGYPITVRHGYGDAATELINACDGAGLLVVGSRGRSPLAGVLLGSVSHACLTHAPCPTVVVRPQPSPKPLSHRVIVGIDMSGHSRQALRVAAEEARLRAAALHVIHAVHWDHGTGLISPTSQQLVDWGRALVAAELAETKVTGRPVIVQGSAPDVLVRHSDHADLLVLGWRGHHTLSGMLLGSTSDHCARYAHCPVMIVRQ